MATTIGMTGPVPMLDDAASGGAHRSRLSIHFNTPRVRRWLLVQIVSVPVSEDPDPYDSGAALAFRVRRESQPPAEITRLLDNYSLEQSLRRWI